MIRDNGGATLTLTVAAFIDRAAGRHPARPARGPLPRLRRPTSDPALRDHHLRGAGLLRRLPAAVLPRPAARPAHVRRGASPITVFDGPDQDPHPAGRRLPQRRHGAAIEDVLKHLILPAVTLGLLICGVFIRLVRVNMLQTMQTDYVEAAEARGIKRGKVTWRARVPQRAGAGDHRDRAPVRAAAGRRGPDRDDVQLARARSEAGRTTSTTATTAPSRGSSRSSPSRWC